MQINGTPLDKDNVDGAINALDVLPTGFSSRTILSDEHNYLSPEALKYNKDGAAAFADWQKSHDNALLHSAAQHFQKAAELSLKANDPIAQAENLDNYAWMMIYADTPEKAISPFESVCAFYKEKEMSNFLYPALGGLHKAVLNNANAKESLGLMDEAAELRAQLRPLRQRSLEAFPAYRGEGKDPDAFRIEQGELGFSADKKIGTDNVNECVCIIIQNPVTKKTALAHVDAGTSVQSLELAITRLENDSPSPADALQARIIGARFGADSGYEKHEEISRNNLERIILFLDEHHVDVLSAAILDVHQPTSIVIDPKTFTVTESSPDVSNPDVHIANIKPCVVEWGKPLQIVFDLTVSDERAAVYFSRSAIANLKNNYAGKPEQVIYNHFSNYSDQQLPSAVEEMVLLTEAYRNETDRLIEKLNAKVSQLAKSGITVPKYETGQAALALLKCPLHLGQGAEKANEALEHIIDEDLFRVRGNTVVTDIVALERFEFPKQPYRTLEARGENDGLPSNTLNISGVTNKRNTPQQNER